MEREAFLGRVRAAATTGLPDAPPADPGLLVPDLAPTDLIERFRAGVEAVNGRVHDSADAVATVVDVAAQVGPSMFLAWDDVGIPGVCSGLEAAGWRRLAATVPTGGRVAHQKAYYPVVLGVTGAEAGFAESGTIVLRSGPGRPRMASLIPDVHIALLPRSALHRSLAHWAAENAASMADASNVVFITGVSRTGDIEMRLNTGVHGPRALHIVLT